MVSFESAPAGAEGPGLGTNANTVTPFAPSGRSREGFKAARRQRFERRATSSRWLVDATVAEHGAEHFAAMAPRPATCGWAAGSHVGVHKSATGPARYSDVQSCGSVWGCPCCGAIIRTRRSEEVQQAASWWEAEGGGYTADPQWWRMEFTAPSGAVTLDQLPGTADEALADAGLETADDVDLTAWGTGAWSAWDNQGASVLAYDLKGSTVILQGRDVATLETVQHARDGFSADAHGVSGRRAA